MSIEKLGEIFKVINPHDGMNPNGNCMHCAVEAARALVTGTDPQPMLPRVVRAHRWSSS
jgi:hypothetical protein